MEAARLNFNGCIIQRRNRYSAVFLNFFLFLFLLIFSTSSYALAYNIVPKAGTTLPTLLIEGQTTRAVYTVTNNTRIPMMGGYVKFFMPQVTQVLFDPLYPDLCGSVFHLLPGMSCTLEFQISGFASHPNANIHYSPLVCNPNLPACAGTYFPLNINVIPTPTVIAITVIPPAASIPRGRSFPFRAIGTFSNGLQLDITTLVTWSSSNTTLATVEPNTGIATGVNRTGATPVVITATIGSVTGNAFLQVTEGFAYVTAFFSNQVMLCSVDGVTGLLSGCNNTGSGFVQPQSITFNSIKSKAYIANNPGFVSLCDVNPVTGILSGCGQTGPTLGNIMGITLNSSNSIIYVAKYTTGIIYACPLDTTGNIVFCTPAGSGFSFPQEITLNAANTQMYVVNRNSNTVSVCNVGSNGIFTSCNLAGSGFTTPRGISLDPTNTRAYISQGGGATSSVSVCTITPIGTFSSCVSTGSGFTTPEGSSITLNSLNEFGYIANLGGGGSVVRCVVNSLTGLLENCVTTNPIGVSGLADIAILDM